jgi:serine O-acetyltransferase
MDAPTPEPAAEPPPWVDPAPELPVPLWTALGADIVAHIPPDHRPRSRSGWCRAALPIIVRSSGFHAVALYRLAHTLHARGALPGRVASAVLYWLVQRFYGCCLSPTARLQGGLILPHPQGIVVGAGAVIGPRGWIFQNVTLGGAPGKVGLPMVGADARLYSGAVLTGPIVLGDNVMIGANAVVSRNVPSRTVVRLPEPEYFPLPDRYRSEGR